MRNTWKTLAVAAVLTTVCVAGKVQAGGFGHGSSAISHASSNFSSQSKAIQSNTQFQAGNQFKTSGLSNLSQTKNVNKLSQVNLGNVVKNGGNKINPTNVSKLNLNKSGINSNLLAKSGKFNLLGGGMKSQSMLCKGGFGWGLGFGFGFGCGNWCGWGCYDPWYCGYGCYDPWYCYSPCYYPCYPTYYSTCYDYCIPECVSYVNPVVDVVTVPQVAVRVVHISNPADTQTTLGFAVNGKTYSLDAGMSQDVQVNDGAVIEFDRGNGADPGRYTLTEGAYRFASTPNGWELFRSAGQADEVAAN